MFSSVGTIYIEPNLTFPWVLQISIAGWSAWYIGRWLMRPFWSGIQAFALGMLASFVLAGCGYSHRVYFDVFIVEAVAGCNHRTDEEERSPRNLPEEIIVRSSPRHRHELTDKEFLQGLLGCWLAPLVVALSFATLGARSAWREATYTSPRHLIRPRSRTGPVLPPDTGPLSEADRDGSDGTEGHPDDGRR